MELQQISIPGARWVFRVYAILAGLAGIFIFCFGPVWPHPELPGLPFYAESFIRVAGGVLMAAACFAAALDRVEDPDLQRRAMLWFAAGHGLFCLVLISQQEPIWNSPLADRVIMVQLLIAFAFLYMCFGEGAEPVHGALTSLSIFTRSATPREDLRGSYQRRIREAALQEERHRLARDLHDSVKQQIFAIQTSAATAQARFDTDPAGTRAALDQVRASAREAMAEMEAMLDQLRSAPLENAGLVASLKQQCEALGFRTGARVDFEVGALPHNLSLAPGAQDALFRIAQEALSNVARHARASHVRVQLAAAAGQLSLTIEDDGAGFDTSQPGRGMGIPNMSGRAAEFGGVFSVASVPSHGTTVRATMPIAQAYNLGQYNRRLACYAALVAVHVAVSIWRQEAFFAVLSVMWCVYFARVYALRSAARRNLEAVR